MKKRGLGIRDIRLHNFALLGKWLWRFGMERNSLWMKVIVAKYGSTSVWDPKDVRGSHGTDIWKSILKVKKRFRESIRFSLGAGEDIQFWEDAWCGPSALKVDFNSIFSIAIVQSG